MIFKQDRNLREVKTATFETENLLIFIKVREVYVSKVTPSARKVSPPRPGTSTTSLAPF